MSALGVVEGRRGLSRGRQALADASLVAVTFIWGSTFVLVKDLIEQVPPLFMLTLRFAIAAAALTFVVTLLRRWSGFSTHELAWGALLGLTIGLGYAAQTVGLQYTTASNAGFITGLLVVIAPIMAIFVLKQMPSRWAIAGVLIAAVGLALLSLHFEAGIQFNSGDPIVLICAFAFAVQVVILAHIGPIYDPLRLTLVQMLVAGVINGVGSLAFEYTPASVGAEVWIGAAFLGIMATAVAFCIQTAVQSYTTVIHASLIYTLEPVFAALFGIWLQGDQLGPAGLTGAALIVSGMLLAELGPQFARQVSR